MEIEAGESKASRAFDRAILQRPSGNIITVGIWDNSIDVRSKSDSTLANSDYGNVVEFSDQ